MLGRTNVAIHVRALRTVCSTRWGSVNVMDRTQGLLGGPPYDSLGCCRGGLGRLDPTLAVAPMWLSGSPGDIGH